MAKRKMTALQRKYFGKRKTRVVYRTKIKRRYVNMARRRGRSRGSRGGFGGGKFSMFAPAIAGLADNIIDSYSPIDGIGSVVVGFGLRNQFSKDMGMYKIGYSAANMLPIPRGGTGAVQGGML